MLFLLRIFISTLVVIQNNPNVQTQGDRLIKVGCIMSNATLKENRKEEAFDVKLQLHDSADKLNSTTNENEDDMPNAIALESSLEFSQR